MSTSLARARPASAIVVAWSVSGAFALAAGAVVFAAVQWVPVVVRDPDTPWHITVGEWILAHHAVPATDTFSFTALGRPWVAHEWLSEVILALAYRAAGWTGLMILTAALAGVTVAAVAFHVRRQTRVDVALMLVLLMVACGGTSLLARPHLIALPIVALWTIGLVSARARHVAPSFGLLPLMMLWANLHGGFIVGLALAGAFAVEAATDPLGRSGEATRRWGIFVVAAVTAAALTPHGIDGLMFPFRLVWMRNLYQIQEWRPSDVSHLSGVTVSLLLALYLGLTGKLLLPRYRVLLLAGLLFVTLQHARNAMLFGVIGPLLIADALGSSQSVLSKERIISGVLAAAAVISLALRIGFPLQRSDDGNYPAMALASVPRDLRERPVLNEYGFGGLLIFSGVRPFIDGRADLYGDEALDTYMSIINADGRVLDAVLCRYRIAWTIFGPDSVVPALLDRTPGWRRLYSDKFAVVHARDRDAEAQLCPEKTSN